MRKKFLLTMFSLVLFAFCGTSLHAQVAKVGNNEYGTIDEAIANWTNGTTLTLLADVTLSDVVTLKSTEHHTLDLGTYTMTAASGKNAIEITCQGLSNATYAITVNADANNPGGIIATGKACIYYSKSDSTKDRPIIRIYNGVFNGSYSINSKSNGNTNCPQIWIYGGTFNGNVNLTKNMLRVFGGTFNGWINCTGDSSAYREISGGKFKSWQFMTADADSKFWVGTSKANYNVGCYVDDNGYLVVGGDVVKEAGETYEASSANYGGWSSYLKYSSAATNGLYYTSVEKALAANNKSTGSVTVYVDKLDMDGISYKGTIVVPEGKDITITNAPSTLQVKLADGTVLTPDANGTVATKLEVATLDELQTALAAENELPIIITKQIEIPADETVVLDLNGKTVNSVFNGTSTTNHIYALSNKGTLTIQNSKGNGSINSRGIYNYGSLTLNAGAINAIDGNGGYAVNNQNGSTFVMNGGVVAATYEDDHQSSSGGYDATALRVPAGCEATLNGGTINNVCDFTFAIDAAGTLNIPETSTITVNGTHGAIAVSGGVTTIDAGTFQIPADNYSRTDNVLYVYGGSLVVNGGTFIGDSDTASGGSCLYDAAGTAVVNGGTFKGSSGGDVWGTTGTTIKGGTFENLTNKQHIAAGYELGADGTVVAKPVASINGTKYTSISEAVAAAQSGDEIVMLADVTLAEALTLPAGITFNGNGKQITGTLVAAGDITFAGVTKAGDLDFAVGNTVVNIPAGASLQLNGSARMSIGFGTTFNITGNITEAKTANVADLTPSLVIPGASFSGAGVKFNVTNAYISVPSSYCSTSKTASGTFDFNITNSIWESAGKLAFEEQSVNAKVDFALVNSVLTTGSHLVFGTASGEEGVVIDNSLVNEGTSRQLENCGTMTIKNGSVVNGAVATSSNAKNPGTVIVENATYAVTGEFSGSDLGTGTLIIKKGATVSAGSITKANITIDAEGMTASDAINLTANLSKLAGTISVINNDKLEAKIDNGKIVLVKKPVAKIGEQGYATLQAAVAAVQEGETITILAGTISEGTVKLPATLKNVTLKGSSVARSAEGAILEGMTISAADGNSYSYVNLTFDGITFDNSRILLTGWRNGEEVIENLTVTNCTFKNLNDGTNTAPIHINKDAAEAVKNFTFTNNVIDGATGGSKSGIYAQVTGNVVVENNIINNVSFRPYVIQVTTDDGIADNFVVKGNTFSGSAVGRAQGLGNNAEGTDNVNIVVSNNIFKGITDAQQICYWNFNAAKTTADLSKNYYDIDIEANPSRIYYNAAASNTGDLVKMGVFPIYTELAADGTINTESAYYPPVAKVGENTYATLSTAFAAVTSDAETVVVLRDVTENLTGAYLRGNITTENNAKVTITLTNSDWVYCPYTFVLGENITLNVPALFYYAGGTQINGTLVVNSYYQRYGSTKLTINEPGSMTVTSETCIIRYMDGDPNAGIYVVGDNNDETVGLKLSVAYFYQGMINAKDANIVAGTYWQTNETDGQGSANLVLDNSTLTVTVYDHPAKATGNSTVTLTNGSVLDARNGGFTYDEANATLSVDKTSKIIGKNNALVELPVAKIGTTKYTSLQAAINAAAEGATITMISDCELTAQNAQELFKPAYNRESYCGISIPDDKAIVLDLNGCTVSYVDAYGDVDNVMVLNLGNLTINDSQGGGKLTYKPVAGTSQYSKFYSTIFNCGTVTVNGGTVENTCETATDVTNAVDNHSRLSHEYGNDCVLTVNGGTLTGSEYYSIRQYTHYLEGVKNRVVINGGTFNNGIYMQHGESWYYANPSANRLNVDCGLTINGGTFNTNYEGASCVVSRLSNPDNNAWNIEINGGTFNAPIKLRVQRGVYYANGVSGTTVPAEATGARNAEWLEKNGGFVKGGTFADLGSEDDVTSDLVSFLAAGYKFEATSEGKFGVVVDPAYGKVAKIGNDYYETLAAAVDAAQENDEVVIFRAGTYALKVKNNVTITGAVNGVEFANIGAFGCNGANVTFNNVTFTYANNSTYKGLQHSGNLVYNNCTFNGQVFLYGASETFNGCTFNTTDKDNYNVWTYSAENVAFNECVFNCAGKSVLIYHENASVINNVAVAKCQFIASQAVEGKAAIEMDSSLTSGINLTIDAATTATGFGEGNVSGNSLWNNKKGNADAANNDITVKVGDDVVLAPIYEAQIGEVKYRKLADAIAAAQAGDVVKVFEGTYAMPSMKAGITIIGEGNVLFEGTLTGTLENLTMKNIHIKGGNAQRWAYAKGDLVFENVTFEATSVYALHFDGITAGTNLTYKNCTIIGWAALGGTPASCTFEGCTIKGNGTYGLIRTYFNTTIKDCTFDVANVNTNDVYQDGIHAVEGAQVTVTNCTNANGDMKDLVNVHANSVVTVDGVEIKNVAKIGDNYYLTLQEAFAAAQAGDVVTVFEGTYAMPSMKAGITVEGQGNVLFEGTLSGTLENLTMKNIHIKGANAQRWAYAKGNLLFENVTFEATSVYALHFDGIAAGTNLTYKDCTIIGWAAMGGSPESCTFDGCTIKGNGTYGVIRTYFDATIQNCTFDVDNVNTTDAYQDGIHAVEGATVTVNGCTNLNGNMNDVVNVHGTSMVVLDGKKIRNVAKIGGVSYTSLQAAIDAANDDDIITLSYVEANGPIEMNAALYGKNVTITGTAKVDWSKGFLFVGRGGEGNATLTFDGANLTSASNNASTGIHVSGREKNTTNKYDGTVVIKNSTIVLDYLINKGAMTLDNATLTVKNGFAIGGRPASETESGNDATATIALTNGSKVVVNNHNGMGLGYEAIGVMNVDATSTFETTQSFLVTAKGTMNIAGTAKVAGTLTNNGAISFKSDAAVLETTNAELTIEIGYDISQDKKVAYRDGAYKVVDKDYVAQVGTQKFETLQEAINAVADGETVTLIGNVTFTETTRTHNSGSWYDGLYYIGDKSFTIDLGGFTIGQDGSVNDYLLNFKNDGAKANTITLKNGTIDAGTAAYCAICTSTTSTQKLTINTQDINIINNIYNGSTIKLRGGAELNVNAGTIITGKNSYLGIECVASTVNIYDGAKIYMNGTSSYNGCLVGACSNGTVNVYGGYGKGVKGGFIAMTSGGTINIDGGEWIANTDGTVGNNSNLYVLTAQSNKYESGFAGPSIINVTGGTFHGGMDAWVLNNIEGEKAELNISGGNFNVDPSAYVIDNFSAIQKGNNLWVVKQTSGELTRTLPQGWSWFSSYVKIAGAQGLTTLESALGTSGVQIKDEAGRKFAQYSTTSGWYGSLTSASSEKMYSINTSAAVDVNLDGDFFGVENYKPILAAGWNYMAYPHNETLDLATALRGFAPVEGDIIKSKSASAIYLDGSWYNAFDLVPGEGYMYRSQAGTKQVSYTTEATRAAVKSFVSETPEYWTVDATQYPGNMTMIATLDVEGGDYEVAAFVNGELRGSARPIFNNVLDQYIVIMTINGDEAANVTFKYYDYNAGEEYDFNNVAVYSDNAVLGSTEEPYALTRGTTGIGEATLSDINIYPNPTTTDREINLQATCDKVEVFNALGVKVVEYQNVDTIDALETAGTYVIRVTLNGDVKHCRLVVK